MTTYPASFIDEKHVRIGGYLKESVFGFNDGIVSTFAVIAGLNGGLVEERSILLAALATLFAGAFSMGLGTYIGSKSEKDLYESERRREIYEMKHMPEVETEEIRVIYRAKGFEGKLLEDVVKQITSNDEVWLKTMMTDELGFADAPPNPGMNGLVMSISFTIGSGIATLPYFLPKFTPLTIDTRGALYVMPMAFILSFVFSGLGLFVAGALKTKFTKKHILMSAAESLLIGALAAGSAYAIGLLFA